MYFESPQLQSKYLGLCFIPFLGIKKQSNMLKIHCKKIDFQNHILKCSKLKTFKIEDNFKT